MLDAYIQIIRILWSLCTYYIYNNYIDYMCKNRPFSLQILCTHRSHRTCKKKNNQVCSGYNYYCMDIIHSYLQPTADGLEQLDISGKLDDW